MKITRIWPPLAVLALLILSTPVIQAAKPVDNDQDGFTTQQDCNDNDSSVYPGAPEICGDGIDQSCSGSDEPCSGGTHADLSWTDYPTACMTCHDGGQAGSHYDEVWSTTHYQWLGMAPDMLNQPASLQGKLTNAVNSYCINILGDWPVCGSCHVGRGVKPGEGDTKANIDCLACHNADYALARVRLPDGSMGPPAGTDQATLDGYVQNIGPPTRASCLKCHANAGGGDGVKRGDLSMSLISNSDHQFDVHMNTAGPNLQCQDCHVFQAHKTIGKGSDIRPTDDVLRGSEVSCSNSNCHANMASGTGHATAGRRTEPDRHIPRVACQSCHIPTYAKWETEVHRNWFFHHDGEPADCDVTPCPGHPLLDKGITLTPELRFWNRQSDNYLLGDVAVLDPDTGAYPTSRPLGDVNADDPLVGGKLTPFKYKTADAPIITSNNVMIALDTQEYLSISGDVDLSVASGLQNMGYSPSEPYYWGVTDTFQMINHGVNPASDVADCTYCHQGDLDTDTDSKLDVLGYRLKGPKEEVCNQCHDGSKKLPRTWDRMHNHIDKGTTGIGCSFCHTFERPERGLCSACDASCSAEYVDNVPYPHECN